MPRFDLQEFPGPIQTHRVTILPLVPPIVLSIVKHPAVAQFDLIFLLTVHNPVESAEFVATRDVI